jgi:hypothetical protein
LMERFEFRVPSFEFRDKNAKPETRNPKLKTADA